MEQTCPIESASFYREFCQPCNLLDAFPFPLSSMFLFFFYFPIIHISVSFLVSFFHSFELILVCCHDDFHQIALFPVEVIFSLIIFTRWHYEYSEIHSYVYHWRNIHDPYILNQRKQEAIGCDENIVLRPIYNLFNVQHSFIYMLELSIAADSRQQAAGIHVYCIKYKTWLDRNLCITFSTTIGYCNFSCCYWYLFG